MRQGEQLQSPQIETRSKQDQAVWEGEYNSLQSQQDEKWSEQEQAMWEGEHNSLQSP